MSIIKVTSNPKYLDTVGILLLPKTTDNYVDFQSEETVSTFVHEIIHHINTISSNYLYLQSLLTTQYSLEIAYGNKERHFQEMSKYLVNRDSAYKDRSFGISIVDLLEGNAVLCSYRYGYKQGNVNHFLEFRNKYFPGKGNSPYRRTFDVFSHSCGVEAAFDLLPVLTFLALQGDIPGRSFEIILSHPKIQSNELVGLSLKDIIKELHYNEIIIDKYRNLRFTPKEQQHLIFHKILVDVFNKFPFDNIIEFFGRPWKINEISEISLIQSLYPPIFMGSYSTDERVSYSAYGLASNDKDFADLIITIQSMVGATYGILGKRETTLCPHTNCSSYSSNLCSGWFLFGQASTNCGFRNRTLNMFKKEPYEILKDRKTKIDIKNLTEYIDCDELENLFPGHESIPLEKENTFSEKFDDHYLLDTEDNDSYATLGCDRCKRTFTGKFSFRAIRNNVSIKCPYCGFEKKLDREDFAWINMNNT